MPTLTGVRLYGPKDTDANWKKNNPSITAGEFIVVTDSKYKFKIATTTAKYSEIGFPVAEKATQLETARKIGSASFNGTADITLAQIGAAAASHTHTKSQITDFPTSLKNPTAITIKFNSGTTEGTNLFTYDGSTAKTLNITPSAIGAAASSHSHSYVPISGGTMTGLLTLLGGKYEDSFQSGALNLQNSDIYNVNSIKFADLSDTAAEGLQWYRDATHTDSFWVQNGTMYFTPNREWGKTGTNYILLHSGNYTSYTVTKTGSGASGTWGISISGNAATATSATTATTANTANSVAWGNVTGKPSSFTPASHTHTTINGTYTGNGGQQKPSYIGSGTVRFNMMDTSVNSDSNYKDWILMDTYTGNDVPWVTAFGIDKSSSPRAFIMVGAKGNSEKWTATAELLSTINYTSYTVTKTGSGASGTWGISITGNAATATTASSANAVAWTNVSGKPSTFTPASHTHTISNITDFGTHVYDATISRTANTVLAAPNGSNGAASFRKLVAADIPSLSYLPLSGGTVTGQLTTNKAIQSPGVGKTGYIQYTEDGYYNTTTSSVKGVLKITLPKHRSSTMFRFKVSIYNYTDYGTMDYIIGGYNYGSSTEFHSCSAYCIGDSSSGLYGLTVQYANDGTNDIVYIGDTSTSWSYPKVLISEVLLGHNNSDFANWVRGWKIEFATAISDVKKTISNTAKYANKSHTHTKSQITDFPTSMPASDVYSWAKASTKPSYTWSEIGSKPSTFTPATHTHTKSQITDFPSSMVNPTNLIIKLNSGTTEGTNLFTYNGGTAKTVNITPSSIGAAASSHTHNYAGSSSAGGVANSASALYINPSSRQTSANLDLTSASYNSRVTYMVATSSMTTGKPPVDAHILTFGWDSTAGWGSQLAIGDSTGNHLYIRGCASVDNKSSWENSWRVVLDSGNYNTYTVTKTGSGASGTWGISISGNAATATTASAVAWANVSGKPSTFTPATHTHTKSQITDFPTSLQNPNSITIKFNSGSTEGTNLFTYNGSATKTLNITASAIGAAASSHTHTKSQITDFPSSMPASDVYSWAKASTKPSYSWSEIGSKPSTFTPAAHTHSSIVETGSSSAVPAKAADGTVEFYYNVNNGLTNNMPTTNNANAIISLSRHAGDYPSQLGFSSNGNVYYRAGAGTTAWKTIIDSGNYTSYTVTKTGSGASGTWGISISGNAATATTASTANAVAWGNVSGKPSTFTPSTHTHSYVPLSGGTMTGTLNLLANQYTDSLQSGSLNLQNSDIYNVNSIKFADLSDTAAEGLQWYRDSTHTDSLWVNSGVIYFTPNREWGKTGTNYTVIHSGNYTSYTVTKTGSGASGTWGISISGNAASASSVAWGNVSGKPSSYTPASHTHSYIPLSGGTITGTIKGSRGGSWVSARDNVLLYNTSSSKDAYNPVVAQKTPSGVWTIGNLASNENLYFCYVSDSGYSAGNNSATQVVLPVASGTIITSASIGSQSVSYASSAGSVAWTNVSGRPSSLPASDVYSWAKASTKPSYSWSEIGSKPSTFTPSSHDHNRTTLYTGSGARPTNINFSANTNGSGTMFHFVASSSTTTGKPPEDSNVLQMNWDNNGGYDSQFAINTPGSNAYFRGQNGGTWTAWHTLLHSDNYTSYTVTKTGSGASGSWGISITGNAASASKVLDCGDSTATTFAYSKAGLTTTSWVAAWNGYELRAIAPATLRSVMGAAASSHTHTKSQISDFPTSLQNPNSITIKLNGGSTEGTNLFTYNGSSAKTLNITYSNVGAAAASHTHNYAGSSSAGGSATSAVKLQTSRNIKVGTAAVSNNGVNFDGSGNITIPVDSVKEAYLTWGGKNFAGSYGPIDAAMVPDLGANRLAFGSGDGITIEYSRDSGSTWTDYGLDKNGKANILAGGGNVSIGKSDSTNKATASYMLRITLDTDKIPVYTILHKFAIYLSTNGSTGTYCTIQASLESTPTTWVTFADKISVSGWSGWNIINTSGITTYGNTKTSQYGLIRFTFGATGGSSTYSGMQIYRIMGFGGVGWTTPSNMARYGSVYSYDVAQNVTFPATVTAKTFSGSLAWGNITGKPSTYTPASHTHSNLTINVVTGTGSSSSVQSIVYNGGTAYSISVAGSDHTHSYLPLSGGTVTGNTTFNDGVTIKNAGLELYYTTPFIDFHKDNSTSDYTSRIIENAKGVLNINGATFTNGGGIWGKSLQIDGSAVYFSDDIKVHRGINLSHNNTSLYVYNESGSFCMMYTNGDNASIWPIIWDFKNSDLYFNGNFRVTGNGSFGKGLDIAGESKFYNGSYTDPSPGTSCAIKASGTIATNLLYVQNSGSTESQVHARNNLRDVYLCASGSGRAGIYDTKYGWIIYNETDIATTYIGTCKIYNGKVTAKADSTSWLVGAQPGGASFESINTTSGALVPGWRVRTYDGAWVGASYAYDPGFRIYYATASRLSNNNSNAYDQVFTFGSSGIFYTKSLSQTSDERRKDVVEKLDTVLPDRHKKFFMDIKPFTFKWNDNPEDLSTHYGVGAQTLYKSAKDLGFTDDELGFIHKGKDLPDGTNIPWSVTYEELIPLNIKITQDHERELEEQKKEIVKLKEENKNLSVRIDSLEKENQKILAMLSELLKK